MQLLRLEMKGFKSFADKTVVKFSPGMTAIVGPNGSGKSNVTDAMRWVLGESNVRNLRGQKAEDIIFSGTVKRRPMGAAEATLVFDNSDGTLDVDMAEVAITRRIYRSGETEFMINKRKCRLKDIHMLLADTGLGKDSMAIIGQNRIDAILNSKPEERRLIFEDVAGISRFKLNKEDALRRINATERNMERVGDVMSTLEDQLVPLADKAEKTRQYMELSRTKREFDGALGYHAYKTADRLFTRFENDNLAYQAEDTELEKELTLLEAKRQKLQLDSAEGQDQLKAWEEQFAQVQREEERLVGQLRLLEEQAKSAERDRDDRKTRLSELQATKEAEGQQVLILDKLIGADQEILSANEGDLQALEVKYQEAGAKLQAEQTKLQASQNQANSRQEQHLEIMADMERARLSIDDKARELSRLEEDLLALKGDLEKSHQALAQAKEKAATAQADYDYAQDQCESLSNQEKAMVFRMRDNQKRMQKAQNDIQKAQGRLEVLEQWAEQNEGYIEGTKNVLKAKEAWSQDVKGAIGDLFTVEPKFALAIEIALGGAVNNVVMTTAKAASQAVSYLKRTQGGRVTFLPMDSVKGRLLETPALGEAGVIGRAIDCIDYDPSFTGAFQQLLGRTLVVKDMDQAIEIQKKYKQSLRLVTLTGEQFQPGGSLTGGTNKRRKASVLSRKEEMVRLLEEVDQTGENLRRWQEELAHDQSHIDAVSADRQSWEEKRQHRYLLKVAGDTQVANEAHRLEGLGKDLDRIEVRKCELTKGVELLEERLKELQGQLDTLVASQDASDSTASLMAAIPELQEAQQKAYEAFTHMRLQCQSLRQSIVDRKRQKEARLASIANLDQKLVPLSQSLAQVEERLAQGLPQERQVTEEALQEVRKMSAELGQKRDQAYAKTASERQAMEDILQEQQDLTNRQKKVQARLLDMESRLTRYKMEAERAQENLQEMGYSLEEAGAIILDGSINEWKQAQADLMAQIAALGSVNPNAMEEYEEAKGRYDFLQGQLADLEEAKGQLEAVIAEMDKAMSTQLLEVLDLVGKRFQEVFSQLFGGGSAQIVLTDPDAILTSGIDFYIQPPGKKRQQLTLLSGGERALTVIALLFSFLFYRPAPFCVLDEVDAALDEANVERFSAYLKHLDHSTQFIVVSHRKPTMEAAEVLQGVTMVERGVSRLLTVSFEELKEEVS